MSKPLISTSTLECITSHANASLRLAQYFAQSQLGIFINKLAYLTEDSDPKDLCLALQQDISSTVGMMQSLAKVLDTLPKNPLDENHAHLLEEKNNTGKPIDMRELFPEHYDPKTRTMIVFGQRVKANSLSNKEQVDLAKAVIYHGLFDVESFGAFSYDDFGRHLSMLKKLSTTDTPTDATPFNESLKFAIMRNDVADWRPFYQHILKQINAFHDIRKSLTPFQRQLVEDEIFTGRAMIYGVAKTSTYMTRDSIVSVSSKHKKSDATVQAVFKLLQDIPYIRGVEIDQDTDIVKFHDMLVDIKGMNMDVAASFELKSRKLGNYGYSGVFARQIDLQAGQLVGSESLDYQRGYSNKDLAIVAVDVESPTSLAHELTHFRDQETDAYRENIISHFKKRMSSSEMTKVGASEGFLKYIFNSREVLARLGEIGFLLNQHNYRDGESFNDFKNRIHGVAATTQVDHEKLSYQVSLVKTLGDYAGTNTLNREMYFNLEDWEPQEFAMVRDYTHDFFWTPDESYKRRLEAGIKAGVLEGVTLTRAQQMRDRGVFRRPLTDAELVGMAFGMVTPSRLADIYKAGAGEGFFADGEFVDNLSVGFMRLGLGGTKNVKNPYDNQWLAQFEGIANLAKSIDATARPGDAILLPDMMSQLHRQLNEKHRLKLDSAIDKERETLSEAMIGVGGIVGVVADIPKFMRKPSTYAYKTVNSTTQEKTRKFCEILQSGIDSLDSKLSAIVPRASMLVDANDLAKWEWMKTSILNLAKEQEVVDAGVAMAPLERVANFAVLKWFAGVDKELLNDSFKRGTNAVKQDYFDTGAMAYSLAKNGSAFIYEMKNAGFFDAAGIGDALIDKVIKSHIENIPAPHDINSKSAVDWLNTKDSLSKLSGVELLAGWADWNAKTLDFEARGTLSGYAYGRSETYNRPSEVFSMLYSGLIDVGGQELANKFIVEAANFLRVRDSSADWDDVFAFRIEQAKATSLFNRDDLSTVKEKVSNLHPLERVFERMLISREGAEGASYSKTYRAVAISSYLTHVFSNSDSGEVFRTPLRFGNEVHNITLQADRVTPRESRYADASAAMLAMREVISQYPIELPKVSDNPALIAAEELSDKWLKEIGHVSPKLASLMVELLQPYQYGGFNVLSEQLVAVAKVVSSPVLGAERLCYDVTPVVEERLSRLFPEPVQVTLEIAPEVAPAVTPDVTPAAALEVAPESAPAVTQKAVSDTGYSAYKQEQAKNNETVPAAGNGVLRPQNQFKLF